MVREPDYSKEIHPKLSKLVHLSRAAGIDLPVPEQMDMLPDSEDIEELVSARGRAELFLGFYTQEMIEEAFERYGVTEALKQKGFENIIIRIDPSDPDRQRLILCYDSPDPQHLLAEAAFAKGRFVSNIEYFKQAGVDSFNLLFIQWLCMQDPRKRFSKERPALPGQCFPGLGIGLIVGKMLEGMVRRLSLDGILNIPEFMHNAILYDRRFDFLLPQTQGKLDAIRRDLADLSLAEISWGVELGCIYDEVSGDKLESFREEQIFPVNEVLVEYFGSEYYRTRRQEAANSVHYVFDRKKFEQNYPLKPDYSPKEPPPLPGVDLTC